MNFKEVKMKGKPSLDHLRNENASVDLTKPLVITPEINSPGEYNDPELKNKTWCSYMEKGFRVSRIIMDTQTGTHIDAPAHFSEGETHADKLQPDKLKE